MTTTTTTTNTKCKFHECSNDRAVGSDCCAACLAEHYDACACGTTKPKCRVGCDDCEHLARMTWHETRPVPILPDGWWRKYEPESGCSAAYLYGIAGELGTHASGRPAADIEHVYACRLGVRIEGESCFEHLEPARVFAIVAILNLAVQDHLAMKAFGDDYYAPGEAFEKAVAVAASQRKAAAS